MDLQNQARLESGIPQRSRTPHHCHLHDVCGGALDHHVHREPLPLPAQLPATGAELRNLPPTTKQSRDVTVLCSLGDRLLDEPRDRGEPGHIALDELLGLLLGNVEPVGHPPRGQAVHDPVIDHLRL